MAYHHVVAKLGQAEKHRVLFSDLSLDDLRKRFILPYERGTSFFAGNDLISPNELRSLRIIKTERTEQEERKVINEASLRRIDEINRNGWAVFISPGSGYDPEDIAEAGEDVTHSLVNGPPGFKSSRWSKPTKVLAWFAGIIAAVVVAGVIKWLGWR